MSKKETKKETSQSTAVTQANTPSWIQSGHQQYVDGVTGLMNQGASAFTPAGPNALQQKAFSAASNLGGSQNFDLASMLAQKVGAAGPNTTGPAAQAGSYGYNPTTATSQGYSASGPVQVNGYNPAQTSAQGYGATNATAANAGQAQGYNPTNANAASAGQAQGYTATNANTATAGPAQGYNPALMDLLGVNVGQTTVGPTSQASSRSITDLDLSKYLNAGLGDQITAAKADYDAAGGQVRAQQSALAALNGGRRNSGNDIRAALTEGELYRAANTGLANIRANAYDQAGSLATSDLNREASTSAFNAGQNNQASLAQAQIDAARASQLAGLQFQGAQGNQNALNQAGQFNSAAQNEVNLANAGFSQQANLANANAANAAGQFGAGAANDFSLANAGFSQQANLSNAAAANAAAQFGAGAANDFAQTNAGLQQQTNLANASAANAASQFGANAQNSANLANTGFKNDALSQLLGLQTQAGMDYAGRQDAAGQFGASAANNASQFNSNAANQAGQFGAAAANQAGMFNADAINANNRFNAGQMDNGLARQLSAAGLLAEIGTGQGANERGNLALLNDIGNQQYQQDLARQQYPLQFQQIMQSLLGYNPALYAGGTTNSSGSSTSTSKTSDPLGSLGALLGGAGQLFSPIKIPGFA